MDTLHLKAAVAVWEYAERSTKFIFKDAIGVDAADRILDALRAAGADGMTQTAISDLFNRNLAAPLLAQALEMLKENGLATSTEEKTSGATATRWRATEKTSQDIAYKSRYLPLFKTTPSAWQLRGFVARDKRYAKTRAANQKMLEERVAKRFGK